MRYKNKEIMNNGYKVFLIVYVKNMKRKDY